MLNFWKNYYIKKIAFHPYFDNWLFWALRLMNVEELKRYYKKLEIDYKISRFLTIVEQTFFYSMLLLIIILCIQIIF